MFFYLRPLIKNNNNNLIAQVDTIGIVTALHIVITYMQTQYIHIWTNIKQSYSDTYRAFPTRMVYLKHDIEGLRPEWCISTIYHA